MLHAFSTMLGFSKEQLVAPLIAVIILLVVLIMTAVILIQKLTRSISPPTHATVAISPEAANQSLSNFYIMASYNSCAFGDTKNDFVSLAPLINVIAHGCRFLDFEVYDVDDKAVVAVSSSPSFNFKGSFNSIPLPDVLNVVRSQSASASNARDPLFLQFRIKSKQKEICNQLATQLRSIFGNFLLSNEFTFREDVNKNFADVKLAQLLGKVIIAVDMSNEVVKGSDLAEFINIAVRKPGNRLYTSNELAYNPPSDIIDYSFQSRYLVTCVPDVTKPANYNSGVQFNLGIQIIAMQFQTADNNLKLYIDKFDHYAFKLMPEDLVYQPTAVPASTAFPASQTDKGAEDLLNAGAAWNNPLNLPNSTPSPGTTSTTRPGTTSTPSPGTTSTTSPGTTSTPSPSTGSNTTTSPGQLAAML